MKFYKLFPSEFAKIMLCSTCAETRILAYLFIHVDYRNHVTLKYRDVASSLGCCPDTVGNIVRHLVKCDFLHKIDDNHYMLNPACICKGRDQHRCELIDNFNNI